MRVAVVTSMLPPEGLGGAEIYAALVAASLAEEHDVLVVSGASFGEIGAARLARIPALPNLHRDAPISNKLVWHARDQWRLVVHRAVSQVLADFRPDVVHTHAVQGLSAAVFTAIARRRLPHVHTAHDLSLLCARTSMTKGSEFCGGQCRACRVQRAIRGRAAGWQLTRFLAVSEYIRMRHVNAGVIPPETATVLRLGARTERGRVRTLKDGGIHVGFIGALAPHKGVKTLLQAFSVVPETWRLTIAGGGPLRDEVAAAAGTMPNVTFLGPVFADEKDRFFDDIDVLAIPSEWEEPAALVGVEAAARGIPSIVSNRGGIVELPEAEIFRARDVAALRDAIGRFAEQPSHLESASRRLVERRSDFEWTGHMQRLEVILAEAAATNRPTD